jgi:CHAT domain-containing protein
MNIDFAANRDSLMARDLSGFKFVHFATHGILNSEEPDLSGLVLSLVNEKGEPINGFIRLNEIYNLNLNADLVVLSACQTALGKEVRGEGLIGLTRGFMYAGSPRVVASLWKVDDVATAELMKIFYQKMLKDKMRPAAALRAARSRCGNQNAGTHLTIGRLLNCRVTGNDMITGFTQIGHVYWWTIMRIFYSAILALLVTQSTFYISAQTDDQISAQRSTTWNSQNLSSVN